MTYGSEGVTKVYVRKRDTQTIDSSAETTQDTDLMLDNTYTAQAQSFTATNGAVLTSCKFYLKKVNAPTGNIVAKLYAHTGTYGTSSKPTGSALATSANVDVSTLGTDYALVTFSFTGANRYQMSAATYYCISVEYTGDGTNDVKVGADSSSPAHGGNSAYYSSGAWTADAAKDICFYVYGTEEKDISDYHYEHEIVQKLDTHWTFQLKLMDINDTDKTTWILENNEILIFWGTTLRMKGRIEKIEYDNYEICTINGVGMAVKLRDRDIEEEYNNQNTDDIVTDIVGSLMTVDTNTNYGLISMHFASDNRLRALAGTVQAIDYDWWEDWKSTDNYTTDYIDVDDFKGDPTSTKTTFYSEGANMNMHVVNEEIDTYETTNYVTCLGMGDGVNQLKSISYNATDNRTTLDKPLDAILETAIAITDTTFDVFDASGIDDDDTLSIDGEACTVDGAPALNPDGTWTITIDDPAGGFARVHAIGAEVIKTSGKIYCVDSSDLPTDNPSYCWIGQEKIKYTANSSNELTMPAAGRGQAYMHTRIVKPYYHAANAEVWDATYTSAVPEAGSYIAVDGIRSRTFTDISIRSQDLLDYVAQCIRVDREDDVALIKVESSEPYYLLVTTGLVVGDWVEMSDTYTGFSTGTKYEVVGLTYGFSADRGEYCEVEISNYNATLLENTVKETDNLGKYYKGSTNVYQVSGQDDCDGSSYPFERSFYIPPEAVAINKILLSYKLTKYRITFNTTTVENSEGSVIVENACVYDSSQLPEDVYGSELANCTTGSIGSHGDGIFIRVSGSISIQLDDAHYFTQSAVAARITRTPTTTYFPSTDGVCCTTGYLNHEHDSIPDEVQESLGGGNPGINIVPWEFDILIPEDPYGRTYTLQAYIDNSHGNIIDVDACLTNLSYEVLARHTHAINYGISTGPSVWNTTDIKVYIDNGSGTYVDKTTDIEDAIGHTLAYTENGKEQSIDITSYIGQDTGWKRIKIEADGKCNVSSDIFIQTFIQSK